MVEQFQAVLDPIIQKFTTGDHYAQVCAAKLEYFERSGAVHEDDPDYDQRMNLFLNWYLFDRDLPGVDLPPIVLYHRTEAPLLDANQQKIVTAFTKTLHSLFRMKGKALFGSGLVVKDLFSKKKYKVQNSNFDEAFSSGDVFEARLVAYDGKNYFLDGFCFHPLETAGYILDEVKKIRHQDQSRHFKFILQLSGMKLKHQRFSHVDVRHIYSEHSKF